MSMKKIAIGGAVVILLGGAAWFVMSMGSDGQGGDKMMNDRAVATVNGLVIPRSDFEELQTEYATQQGIDLAALDEASMKSLEGDIIDSLIAQALVDQAVEASGITVGDERIDAQMEVIRARFETQEEFEKALSDEGLSEDELRSQVHNDLAVEAYFEQELSLSTIAPTDDEVATTYQQMSGGGEAPPLEEVRSQVEQFFIQQKQQELIAGLIEKLRASADIEITA